MTCKHVYTLNVQHNGNINFIFQNLISEIITICCESSVIRKVLETQYFYVSFVCIPITHSTCLECAIMMTTSPNTPLAAGYIFNNSSTYHFIFLLIVMSIIANFYISMFNLVKIKAANNKTHSILRALVLAVF